jgi:hypothetical protein
MRQQGGGGVINIEGLAVKSALKGNRCAAPVDGGRSWGNVAGKRVTKPHQSEYSNEASASGAPGLDA